MYICHRFSGLAYSSGLNESILVVSVNVVVEVPKYSVVSGLVPVVGMVVDVDVIVLKFACLTSISGDVIIFVVSTVVVTVVTVIMLGDANGSGIIAFLDCVCVIKTDMSLNK